MHVCGSAALFVLCARRLPRHGRLYRNGYATGCDTTAAEACNPFWDRRFARPAARRNGLANGSIEGSFTGSFVTPGAKLVAAGERAPA
jgi:hypothetical protein